MLTIPGEPVPAILSDSVRPGIASPAEEATAGKEISVHHAGKLGASGVPERFFGPSWYQISHLAPIGLRSEAFEQ
jgi:hypothetical protein